MPAFFEDVGFYCGTVEGCVQVAVEDSKKFMAGFSGLSIAHGAYPGDRSIKLLYCHVK